MKIQEMETGNYYYHIPSSKFDRKEKKKTIIFSKAFRKSKLFK